MNIKVEGPLIHKGRASGLFNYHYTDRQGEKMSPTFQGTTAFIEREKRLYSKGRAEARMIASRDFMLATCDHFGSF